MAGEFGVVRWLKGRWPLLISIMAPTCLNAWLYGYAAAQPNNDYIGIVFVPLAFVSIGLARRPVNEYLASGPSGARSVWESLVPFTPGYFRFHASRGGFESRWYLVLLFAQVALLLVACAVIFTYPLLELAYG